MPSSKAGVGLPPPGGALWTPLRSRGRSRLVTLAQSWGWPKAHIEIVDLGHASGRQTRPKEAEIRIRK